MAWYRAILVWLLRGGAALVVGVAVVGFVRMRQAYESEFNPVEAAGLQESAVSFLPSVAVAVICLTLAEILSLLMKQRAQ